MGLKPELHLVDFRRLWTEIKEQLFRKASLMQLVQKVQLHPAFPPRGKRRRERCRVGLWLRHVQAVLTSSRARHPRPTGQGEGRGARLAGQGLRSAHVGAGWQDGLGTGPSPEPHPGPGPIHARR